MSTLLLLAPLALLGGMAVPLQFAVNTQLRGYVGGPISAGAASFIVGAVVLTVAALIVSRGMPRIEGLGGAPWWVWTGGVLGTIYVVSSIVLTPRLGSAPTVGFFLAGQMIMSMIIDQFGLLGVEAHPVNLPRFLGLALIFGGLFLIQRF